jgi:hypothetical protein
MDTEVLVYLQKVKNYLSTNEEAKTYFIGNSDAEKNFEKNGQPELTQEQFELLRKTILAVTISKQKVFYSSDGLFMFFENYPPISMN